MKLIIQRFLPLIYWISLTAWINIHVLIDGIKNISIPEVICWDSASSYAPK